MLEKYKASAWALIVAGIVAGCGGGAADSEAVADKAVAAPVKLQAQASTTLDATSFFEWAQTSFPGLFGGSYQSGVLSRYVFRYYPISSTYLIVASNDVYYLGPSTNGQLTYLVPLGALRCRIFAATCATTSTFGVYTGTPGGASPNSLMLYSDYGTFAAINISGNGGEVDFLTGTAFLSGNFWSSRIMNIGHYANGTQIVASVPQLSARVGGGTMTVTISTAGSPIVGSRLDLTYNPISALPASGATVGGAYVSASTGQNVTIDPVSGIVSGTLVSGCAISGNVGANDPSVNLYAGQATLQGSTCNSAGTYTLIGYYDQTAGAPAVFKLVGNATGTSLKDKLIVLTRAG